MRFKLFSLILLMSSVAAAPVSAQITINSTGVVTGTVVPPSQNPNFNQGTTRVDTDSQGRFFRNGVLVYSAQDYDPRLVRVDASGRYFVDFRGIPIVSTDGTLTSPVLSNGALVPVRRNHNAPTRFHGTIQDELVVLGEYAGIATDPRTGLQYQGTFRIRGQGPRYSDRNGGTSPTVFDFRSHYNFSTNPQIPPTPTVFSYTITSMPVRLWVTIPAGLAPITQGGNPTPGGSTTPGGSVAPGGSVVPSVVQPTAISSAPTPSLAGDPNFSGALNTNQFFEVKRVILEESRKPSQQVGPRSRILLR